MRLLTSSLALLPLIFSGSARAQKDETPVFSSNTRLVVLHASVIDSKGHLLTDLKKEAFRVTENGVEQVIKTFRREDVPVTLGLVIDNSGSMKDKRQRVEAAAINLVKSSNRDDEVFIVNFNDEGYLDVPITNDLKKMEEGVARIDSRGGTALRDAIAMSIDYMKDKARKDKKVLLIVTDGDDTASTMAIEKCAQKVAQSEVLVFAIGLLNQESARDAKRAKRSLDAITHASGGAAYYPKDLTEVEKIAQQVAHEIRNQFTIAYSPTSPEDGGYRTVKVTAKGPASPQVRTRSGYYATPQAAGRKKPAVSLNAPPAASSPGTALVKE